MYPVLLMGKSMTEKMTIEEWQAKQDDRMSTIHDSLWSLSLYTANEDSFGRELIAYRNIDRARWLLKRIYVLTDLAMEDFDELNDIVYGSKLHLKKRFKMLR